MQILEISAEPRTVLGKNVKHLRRAGLVPANVYGHGPSRAIQVTLPDLEHLLQQGGRTSVVAVKVDGQEETTLIKVVQRDPVKGRLLHVDFQAVSMEERVRATVPLHFVGEPPAVRKFGGVLLHHVSELPVEARARDLPPSLEVDLSGLDELHASIKAGDLSLPTGIIVLAPADEVLAVVVAPKKLEEEAVVEAEAAAEVAEAAAAPAEAPAQEAETS